MGNILAFPKPSPRENLFDLPFDVQCEILSGLPLKSLGQFSCASKQARELIDDPILIGAHLKLINSSTDNRMVLILWWDPILCRLKQCSLSSLLCAPTTETVAINYPPFKNPFTGVIVVGCCNGLVCIVFDGSSDGTKIILWNPSTRKSKIVPDLGIRVEEDKGLPVVKYTIYSWGFGYDKIEDDYKVVAVANEADQGAATAMDGEGPKVKVYSTKKGIWKRIGDFQGGSPQEVHGTFVNGKLHWSLEAKAGGDIVSLDLTTETYGRIEKPEQMKKPEIKCDGDSESLPVLELEVYQEKLCLLCPVDYVDNGLHKTHTDVWMMEIYGVTESWKMQFTIRINTPGGISRPLCRSEDGEVLVSTGTKSVRYNPDNVRYNPDNAAYVDIPFRDQNIEVYHAFPYTQSLVSPYAKEEKDAIEQRRRCKIPR